MSYMRTLRDFQPDYRVRLNMTLANETFDRPDFDIPGLLVTEVGARSILIVEGERALMHPIFVAVRQVLDELEGDARTARAAKCRPSASDERAK